MPVRVFLDTNVFIYAFEFPESNSALIIKMLNDGELDAVVSEMVVTEVMRYFKKYYTKDLVAMFRNYLLQSCQEGADRGRYFMIMKFRTPPCPPQVGIMSVLTMTNGLEGIQSKIPP